MPAAAAALIPHPPLLVPELAGGAAPELDGLRAAAGAALATVMSRSSTLILVGDGPVWGAAAPGAGGTFAPYGVDVRVELPAEPLPRVPDGLPEPALLEELPLSLAVAAWLLQRVDARPGRVHALTAPAWLGAGAAAALGRALAATAGQGRGVGVVAMGDLSARRSPQAPGALHPAAAGHDALVSAAVRAGDLPALLRLEPALAAQLLVTARVPLQVAAGALAGEEAGGSGGLKPSPPEEGGRCGAVEGTVLYEDAPYGVGYLVGVLTTR